MALNSQKRRFPARAVGYRIYFVDLAAETGLCKRDWALPLGSSGILQVVDNIITRTSHHESFTMSCTGYILNGILQECCPGKNHPTNKGYKRIATSFFNALKEQVFDVALAAAEARAAAADGATGGLGGASMPAGLGGLG